MPQKIIIVGDNSGRFGNRLLLFMNVVAHAIEHGGRVINPSFARYASRFESIMDDPAMCRVPPACTGLGDSTFRAAAVSAGARFLRWSRWKNGRHHALIRLGWEESCDMSSPAFLERTKDKEFVILAGWLFRDRPSITKHQLELRHVFRPTVELDRAAREIVGRARGERSILLGLHVRRSDYQKHLGGRYFFDAAQYANVVARVLELVPQQDLSVLVCGDEAVELDVPGLDWVQSPGYEAEDMFALARCDLIAGPPSSFNQCASLLGNKPLYTIADPERAFSVDDFAIVPEVPDPEVRRLYWGS